MRGAASVGMLWLIISGLVMGAAGVSAEHAMPARCSDHTELYDNEEAECTIWVPQCTSEPCPQYMLTITVEPYGEVEALDSAYLEARMGGNGECGGLGGCTSTAGPYTAHSIVSVGLPCEVWGLDGFVGRHDATSAKVTCERSVV